MPFSDLPMSVMFVLFLVIFLLVGIYPFWKEGAAKFRRRLREHAPVRAGVLRASRPVPGSLPEPEQPDEFECFVIRRLAQTPKRTLSTRQLAADLHFTPAVVKRALQALSRRGMIGLSLSPLFGVRVGLSEAGRRFALEQGYIVRLAQRS